MNRVGVRELKQNASAVLRRVKAGESVEVTERGRPVARLVPLQPTSRLDQLIAEGKATPATRSVEDLPPPIKLPPGSKPLSEILEEMRSEERY